MKPTYNKYVSIIETVFKPLEQWQKQLQHTVIGLLLFVVAESGLPASCAEETSPEKVSVASKIMFVRLWCI